MKLKRWFFMVVVVIAVVALAGCPATNGDPNSCDRDGCNWGGWVETTPPTCIEPGEETRICTLCGETETRPGRPALGYDWGEWVETTPPTCIEPGEETRACTLCGETETRPGSPALGHDWGEWVETTPPRPTAPGIETRTCLRCGETETRPIPQLEPGEGVFAISFAAEMDMEITGPRVSIATGQQSVTLLNPEQFGLIEWFLGETKITGDAVSGSHGQTLALDSSIHNERVGIHRVTLEVSLGDTLHSRVIVFTVIP